MNGLITIKIWTHGYQQNASINPDEVAAITRNPNCVGRGSTELILKNGYRFTCVDEPEELKRCLGV